MAKPTEAIFPIQNGKLLTVLDANGFQIDNLDTSNLTIPGGGGGGNDTGTTTAILKGDGAHGFADAIADVDYATIASVLLKESITDHDADIATVDATIAALTTTVGLKASTAALTAGLALKADQTDLDTTDAALAALTTAVGNKADSSSVDDALDLKADQVDLDSTDAALALLTTAVGNKADSASVSDALALKADQVDLDTTDAALAALTTAVGNKADSASVSSALALKAAITYVDSQDALKQDLLPTTANDGYILARHNAGAGSAFYFVDPLTLGTTSQSFSDGVENSTTTFTSASANFVANDVGKAITGTNIPNGTTIASRTNSTTIILSAAATATASSIPFTIINRIEVGASGTVTTFGVTNNITGLFTTSVANATTTPQLTIDPATVGANTFYGNGTGFSGQAGFMSAGSARSALGGTTVGQALFQLANPTAISYPRINADNTVTARTPAQTLGDLGAESALTFSSPISRSVNTISMPAASSVVSGHLTNTDFATFSLKVGPTRAINTTAPLTGGGDLSANRTIAIPASTDAVDGYLTAADHTAFNAKLSSTRAINTTAPLTGGGNLTVDRTIAMPAATGSVDGYLTAANFTAFNAKLSSTRTITTTAPLTGGGDLTADRTLAIPPATAAVSGYLTAADFTTFTNKPPNTRTISTTAPLTGGGDLSANRTIAIPAATAAVDGYLRAADFANFQVGSPVVQLAGLGGTLNVSTAFPPVTRLLLNQTLTSALTINLPPAINYSASIGYPFLEIVDISSGGAQTNFGITINRTGSDLIDGVNSITLARGSTYQRLNSNGNNRWASTRYFVDAFKDATDPLKSVRVDVSSQTPSAGYRLIPSTEGDSYTVTALNPVSGQFVTGLTASGVLTTDVINPSDILPNEFAVGNVDTPITNNGTIDTVKLNQDLTATRLYIFPDVDLYSTGEAVRFYASTGAISTTNFARVTTSGTYTNPNTFNGNSSLDITEPFFNRVFVADPVGHNWTVSTFGGGGGGLTTDLFHSVTPVSGVATIVCQNNVVEQHHIVSMSGGIQLAFSGANPGMIGKIKFLDSTGNHTVTVPNSTGKTPTLEGTGTFLTSTGTNVEDLWAWIFDGSSYSFYPLAKKLIAAAPPSFATVADDTDTGVTSGTINQGDVPNYKYGVAVKLTANGGVAGGSSYTVGKVKLRLLKVGNPTYNLYVKFLADSSGTVSATQVGSSSPAVAASTLSTGDSLIEFAPLASLVSGTVYWIVLYGDNAARTVTDGVTNSTTTITSATANFTSADVGSAISGTNAIPPNTTIASVTNSTTAVMSAAATSSASGLTFNIGGTNINNYVSFTYRTVTNTACWRSATGASWGSVASNRLFKYTTYK